MHIVLTGGGSGIGAAIAQTLADEGHQLAITGRRGEKLQQVANSYPNIWCHPCDVADEHQVRAFTALVGQRWETADALINCAAIIGPIGKTTELEVADLLKVLDINVCGALRMIKYTLPLLLKAQSPRIINFAGGGAFGSFPNYTAYAASKAAIIRVTENLAIELADYGVRVNAVAPGFIATEIHDATLKAGPEKAGREYYERTLNLVRQESVPIEAPVACVRFLLSERSGSLTGKTLSASFDPWNTDTFLERIPAINESDLYTQRRINLVNLPENPLKTALVKASARRRSS